MQKLVLIILLFLIVLSRTFAQELNKDTISKLVIKETTEVNVIADQANFGFSVKGFGSTLRQAVENAKNKISVISRRLFEIGLKPNSLSTKSF